MVRLHTLCFVCGTQTGDNNDELNFSSHSANPEAFAGAIHILEAIGINVSRAWSYARQSKGKSIPVSLLLVFSELMVLPSALFFDLWGMIFNRRGYGITRDDFVPSLIRPQDSRLVVQNCRRCLMMNREDLLKYRYRTCRTPLLCPR